jgi:predicted secreted protein
MNLSERDRRALLLLGVVVAVVLVWRASQSGSADAPAEAVLSVPAAEKQVLRLRQIEASLILKQARLKQAEQQLAEAESGLLEAETAAQAQAQLLQTIRRVGKAEGIDARGGEIGAVRPLGDDYGEVSVAVTFDCQIEQLLNFLAALSAEPKLLATEDLRISSSGTADKKLNVRVAVSGVVPRALVPERKGPAL